MKELMKWIGKLLFYAMALSLSIYASSRTLDFITCTLPADKQMIGFLALFATTGGALAWLAVFLYASKGLAQKGISLIMIVIDLVGEFAIFTIDTILNASDTGMVIALSKNEIQTTILGMSLLIAVNIAAIFAYHIADTENMEELENNLADWHIDGEIRKAKKEKAQAIAGEIAEQEAEAYAQEQYAKDRSDKSMDEGLYHQLFGNKAKTTPEDKNVEAEEKTAESPADSFPSDSTPDYPGFHDDDGVWHPEDGSESMG